MTRAVRFMVLAVVSLTLCQCGADSDGVPPTRNPSVPPSPSPADPPGQTPSVPPSPSPADPSATVIDDAPPEPAGVGELRALEGLQEPAAIVRLGGAPTRRREFPMSDCCHEREIELYNTYPPDMPNRADVQIRELTWVRDGYRVVLWLHAPEGDWTVLETVTYADDVEF